MDFFWHLLAMIGIDILAVLSYNLLIGRGKILYFGPLAVSMIAAYGIFVTREWTGSYLIGLPVGLLLASAISLLFAWMALRLTDDGIGILSLAVFLGVTAVVLNWNAVTGGAMGITGIPRMSWITSQPAFAIVSIALGLGWAWLMHKVDRSFIGRNLKALSEHREAAESVGISRAATYCIAFLIAGVGVTITNALYPQYLGLVYPSDFGFPYLVFFLMCVIAGKPGSVPGVTVATILLALVKEGIRFIDLPISMVGPLRLIIYGLILIVALYVRRKEMFPVQRTV
jgi:branched-chain amino acid transport system permease protein